MEDQSKEIEEKQQFLKGEILNQGYNAEKFSEYISNLKENGTDLNNWTLEELQNKIRQSVSQLEATYNRTEKKGELKIYYLKNYPTQTLFYSDDSVVVTPYQVSSGRATIPLYEYLYEEGHNSIASHLFNDLKNVRRESKLISVNGERLTEEQIAQYAENTKKKNFWSKLLFWR